MSLLARARAARRLPLEQRPVARLADRRGYVSLVQPFFLIASATRLTLSTRSSSFKGYFRHALFRPVGKTTAERSKGVRMHGHTDFGLTTLLFSVPISCLQIWGHDEAWHYVPYKAGALGKSRSWPATCFIDQADRPCCPRCRRSSSGQHWRGTLPSLLLPVLRL